MELRGEQVGLKANQAGEIHTGEEPKPFELAGLYWPGLACEKGPDQPEGVIPLQAKPFVRNEVSVSGPSNGFESHLSTSLTDNHRVMILVIFKPS